MELGERLRFAREKKELTQIAVFKKIGIHNKTLSGYENNVASPDPEALKDLALLYEVSSDYLLGLTNEMLPTHKMNQAEVLNRAYSITINALKCHVNIEVYALLWYN